MIFVLPIETNARKAAVGSRRIKVIYDSSLERQLDAMTNAMPFEIIIDLCSSMK